MTAALLKAAQHAIDHKTKPPGSLGRLEAVGVRLAVLQRTLTPRVDRARIVIFAADHGVAAEGVSAYPPQVTAEMTRNFTRGGAAINVLARHAGLEVEVIDVGIDAPTEELPGVVAAKVRHGSRNFLHEPAMTRPELAQALEVGHAAAHRAAAAGAFALGLGEMGIGNTTAAAALLAGLTGAPSHLVVGRGTGVDQRGLERKRAVVDAGLDRHRPRFAPTGPAPIDPREALRCLGGLELAAIAGAALAAPALGIAVVVDGFISTVAVLAATAIARAEGLAPLGPTLFFGHRSAEAGHDVALEAFARFGDPDNPPIDSRPLLDLGMRLGEGTGAALAIPMLQAAANILIEMATFEQAGVSGPSSV